MAIMQIKKKQHPEVKSKLHPRNKHRERYDLVKLVKSSPELAEYVITNDYGDESIDFFNSKAVKALNKALLRHFYKIDYWDIPPRYLVPPVPGRADYLHYIADLLAEYNDGEIPKGKDVKCFDIGIGASCIYPIIGVEEYGWSFIGSEIDTKAAMSSASIVEANPHLEDLVDIRVQENKYEVFKGVLDQSEPVDFSICNPPFHASQEEAEEANLRKITNLKKTRANNIERNFGGISNELWCVGGEQKFVKNMIHESVKYSYSCFWFTSLLSKEDSLFPLKKELERVKAKEVKVIRMGQGNKVSRILAWTFLSPEEQKKWSETKWKLNNK